ncbi:MAG TPA: hypothetical protein VFQ68_15560 [Streptosporangiaceae bacterium]|nr:hypothetical protein [Streptosporangiaceae bacterium]
MPERSGTRKARNPEQAGQLAHVGPDEFTVFVLIGGQLTRTVPSSLDAEDLATLKMRGASPAGSRHDDLQVIAIAATGHPV